MKNNRIIGLDFIKLFSVMLVVMMHTFRRFDTSVPFHPYMYYFTRCAIPLFFMASGYIQLNKETISFKYILNKIKNIYVVCFFWICLYDLLIITITHKNLFISDMLGIFTQHGNFSIFWFMVSLSLIYILTPILLRIFNSKYRNILIITSIMLCLISSGINLIDFYNNRNFFWQETIPQSLRIWIWIMYYLLGGSVKKIENQYSSKILFVLFILTSIISIIYQYVICYNFTKVINSEYVYDHIIVIIWTYITFLFLLNLKYNPKIEKIIAKISVGQIIIYAFHLTIIKVLARISFLHSYFGELMAFVLTFITCCLLGIIINKTKILKKFSKI